MAIRDLQAIDIHAHYGKCINGHSELMDEFMSGSAQTVVERAGLANTCLTVVSPLGAIRPKFRADAVAANEQAARVVEQAQGLLQLVVINPLQPRTYQQAARMLVAAKCVGIKIGPGAHGYQISKYGRDIFEFASEHQAVLLSHSGEQNCEPADFVPLADDYPQVKLILAHLGYAHDMDPSHQVRAIQASRAGNIFVDTSSSRSLTPGLIEWAVDQVGAERILYGTDSPLYFAPSQRARIDRAGVSDRQKELILRDNAERLLGLQARLKSL